MGESGRKLRGAEGIAPVLVRPSSYRYDELRAVVFEILRGIEAGRLEKGMNVLVKPKLLQGATVEQAVTTHPLVVKAVVEFLLLRGCRVTVADSPPAGSFGKIVERCGMKEALQGMSVILKPLTGADTVALDETWRGVELSTEALDADVIVNLPKLKTHAQMVLTLAVKNLFGCVIGLQKPQWHLRVGDDPERFAGLLVEIARKLSPAVTLVDGVLAMEGDGPGTGGTPRELGLIIGGSSVFEVDRAIARMLGLAPSEVPTIRAAEKRGIRGECQVDGFQGEVGDFVLPVRQDVVFGPRFMRGFLRRHLTSRPATVSERCEACDECVEICPAQAVASEGEELVFDYDACIRCYCCLEICPHGAVKKHETWLHRTLTAPTRLFGGGKKRSPS